MADPVNTFFGSTYCGLTGLGGFNPATGEYDGLHKYGFPMSIGDDAGDDYLPDGSMGDSQESTGETSSWQGVVPGICSGWTIGGAPVVEMLALF